MSGSNCCFLTCIQVFQEACKVVWYSHLFKTFPQFVVIHTIKVFGIVSEGEVDAFLEFPCHFYYPTDDGNLISGSSAFSKSSLNTWKVSIHILLKLGWRILTITLLWTIFWPPDVKNWLIWKDPDSGKDWRQEEKGTTEDKMVGSHHQFSGHEFEQAPGDGEGQRSLMCCSPWGYKESDMTERLKTELKRYSKLVNVTTKAQTHRYREQI